MKLNIDIKQYNFKLCYLVEYIVKDKKTKHYSWIDWYNTITIFVK